MHRQIGLIRAVHAQHAQPVLAGCGIAAKAHQRGGDRKVGLGDQLTQQLRRAGARVDDAAARIDDRALGAFQQRNRILNRGLVAFGFGRIRRFAVLLRSLVAAVGELHILRDVDQNRAGTTRCCDVKRLMDCIAQRIRIFHQPVMLGAGSRDADGVRFLKGVVADHEGRDLTRQADHRDRIHQSIRQPGDRVRGAGA